MEKREWTNTQEKRKLLEEIQEKAKAHGKNSRKCGSFWKVSRKTIVFDENSRRKQNHVQAKVGVLMKIQETSWAFGKF